MFSESFKIVYFAGVLASCLGSIAAYCLRNDLECNEKVNEGHLIQQPNYKIKEIPYTHTECGKSPYWDHENQNLYYVDSTTGQILRYNYWEKKVYKANVKGEQDAVFIIPVEGKSKLFVVGCGLAVLIVKWDGYSNIATPIGVLYEKGYKKHTNIWSFYYGKCDNRGRLFAGTGRRDYRFDGKKSNHPMKYYRTTLNVLWDDKRQKIYFIDLGYSNVKEYPYDLETGTTDFTNEKVVMNLYYTNSSIHINAHDMTIDREGNIYVATVNDDRIYVINPEMGNNKVLYTIKMPCGDVTSLVFGGPNLDILYATTATNSGYCGSVFEITGLGSQGPIASKAVYKTKANSSHHNKQGVLPTDDGRMNQKNVQPNYKINKIRNSSTTFGRSLFYDRVEHNLYYVGGKTAEILRYDYLEKKVYKAKVKGERFTSFIIPVESTANQFVVGCGLRVLLVEWDGYSNIATPISTLFKKGKKKHTRNYSFYYGKCDNRGRLFAGTTRNYLRFGINKTKYPMNYNRTTLNVLWDDKRQKIYFIDSQDSNVKEYPYDLETGTTDFTNEKVVMNLYKTNSSKHINAHDMTIDREGNIYVAPVNDGQIYVINPEMDKVLYKIKMPCERLGSVVFGGPNLDILYVTTAKSSGYSPSCGSVFEITGLGSHGTTLKKAVIKTEASSSQSNKQDVLPTDDGRNNQKNVQPNYKINKIRNSSDTFGRSLFYDHVEHNLYYVGGSSAEILRYDYLEKKVYKAKVIEERFTSFIIPVESTTNQFFVGCGLRVLLVEWDGYSNIAIPVDTLLSAEPNDSIIGDRFIYGKCDARGRLFAGTITYNFVRDTEQSFHKRNTGLSKGLVWNDKRKKIYFTDALDFQIKEYPYDLEAGRMDSRHEKVVMDFRRTNSSDHINLDDMTIDREGNIYVAASNDGQIYVINPEMDKVLYKIKMPCEHLGSVVFGGPNLDILYVTTYNFGGSSSSCGSVYKITGLGSYGTTMNKAVIKTKATSSQSNKQEVLPTDDGRKSQKNVHPNYKINKIRNSSDTFGRSLFYDHVQHNLYYVGGSSAEILRYDYLEKKVYKAKVKEERFTSFIIPVESTTNQFFVGCGLRVLLVKWDGYSNIAIPIDTLLSAEPNDSIIGDRFIYGKCDARGRLFAGTITYNFVRDTEQSFHKRNTGLSKGLVWNDKRKKIYFTDALDFQIKEYPYDLEAGRMDSRHEKVVMDFRRTNSSDQINLDDMTIDREGNIYVAASNDGQIYVINPEMDKVLYKIKMPCEHLGSVVFGGPNLDILYVTTYNFGGSSSSCGSVYKITGLGSYGTTMNKAVIKTVVINKVKTIK